MARLSLEILHQLLSSHVVSPDDFRQGEGPQGVALPKPPGHVILEHMLNDSPLLKKVCTVELLNPDTLGHAGGDLIREVS